MARHRQRAAAAAFFLLTIAVLGAALVALAAALRFGRTSQLVLVFTIACAAASVRASVGLGW